MIRRSNLHRQRSTSKQSKSFTRSRRKKKIVIAGVILLSLFVLVFGVSKLSTLKSLSITSIEVYGTDQVIVPDILAAVGQVLEGKYLGILSQANAFIYPRSKITKAVSEVSPSIDRLETKINDRHTLVISIIKKTPMAVVCNSLPDFRDNELFFDESENCYFVDKTGQIFEKELVFSGNAYKRYYAPETKEATSSPVADFTELQNFYDSVLKAGIKAQAILVKPQREYELYIQNPVSPDMQNINSPSIAVVYFNATGDISLELANLLSFWLNTIESVRNGEEVPVFDSIDIRYGSNVFYRLNK